MKRMNIRTISVLLILLFALTGCTKASGVDTSSQKDSVKKEEQIQGETEKKENKEKAEETKEQATNEENEQSSAEMTGQETVKQSFVVYYSNDNADGLNQEEVQQEVTSESVWKALVDKGTVPADASVISIEKVTVDGGHALNLDLSKTFKSFLKNMGTAGETIVIQSVTNTFLNAYDAKKIRITVEGTTLSTGHAEYPGYMAFFN